MVVKEASGAVDLQYDAYLKHQWNEVSAMRVEACAQKVKPSHHFEFQSGKWQANEYEGFAIVSMVESNPSNDRLYFELQQIQEKLIAELDEQSYYFLPPSSFHQTVANTLSADRFRKFLQSTGLEMGFPSMVRNAFENISLPISEHPIRMKLIGLSVFHAAIGILGIIESAEDYERVTSFRSQFYGDQQMASLDVRMTRPFIGHITLAYVERELNKQERVRLSFVVNGLNEKLKSGSPIFLISNTELRRYDNLSEFRRLQSYPTFNFSK